MSSGPNLTMQSKRTLAIAAPAFYLPSETFIRDHVRSLAPGQTVLVCQDGTDAELLGCPVLSEVRSWSPPVGLWQRVRNAIRHRWSRIAGPGLSREDHLRLMKFLEQHQVSAIMVEYLNFGTLFSKACKEARIPLVVHAHGYDVALLLQEATWRRRYRRLYADAAAIVVPSHFLAQKLICAGCPMEKLHVSPCGCDPSRFQPSRHVPGLVLAVGRLVEKKRPDLTIRAFAKAHARHPNSRLIMIGDGPLMGTCRSLIHELDLQSAVELRGVQETDEVQRAMSDASIFVQHSMTSPDGDAEGMPVAILEAMSSSLPIVSTRHSGIPEAVVDGQTGLLVEEGDVEGMARALDFLLVSPERSMEMGTAGRERVLSNFTHEHTKERLLRLLPLTANRSTLEPIHGRA